LINTVPVRLLLGNSHFFTDTGSHKVLFVRTFIVTRLSPISLFINYYDVIRL